MILQIKNLFAGYGNLCALKGISLHVNEGEIVAIIGANGAGKTTLMRAIMGLSEIKQGSIFLKNKEIAGESTEKIAKRGCILVPEGRQVFAPLTVKENLILGASARTRENRRRDIEEDVFAILDIFPQLKNKLKQLAGTLSGGEQQMLAIGRALMAKPSILMMDEPSLGLSPLITKEIFKIILELRQKGNTILLVEQNAKATLKIADRGYVFETGKCIMEGESWQLSGNHQVQRAYLGKEYREIDE